MYQMKKGGSSKSIMKKGGSVKKYPGGGEIDPKAPKKEIPGFPKPAMMKKGGSVGKSKMKMGGTASNNLAGKYGDPNKITRGDIITAAKQNAGKMKMGGSVKSKKK